jgi:hypothetical protein
LSVLRGFAVRHPVPIGAVAVTLFVCTAAGLLAGVGAVRVLTYWATVGGLLVATALLDDRVRFSRRTVAMLGAWAVLHTAGGLIVVPGGGILFAAWLVEGVVRFDQAVHFWTYFAVTFAAWEYLSWLLGERADRGELQAPSLTTIGWGGRAATAAIIACGIGSLNEVIEQVVAENVVGLTSGGYANSVWDIMFNTAGAAAAGLWLGLTRRLAEPRLEDSPAAAEPRARSRRRAMSDHGLP